MAELGNIILIGFMGSGKSSVGRLVARRTGLQFVDTDALVEKQEGKAIPEIFAEQGEEHFRYVERLMLEEIANEKRMVLATGGGIVLREDNRQSLRDIGFVVWLTANEDEIFRRVSRNTNRPLLQTADPRAAVKDLFSTRRELYEQTADCVIDSSGMPHRAVVDRIISRARQYFAA